MQDIYSKQLQDIEKTNFNEFLVKKKKYSTRRSHDNINIVNNTQKSNLIDQFCINGRLQNEKRYLQQQSQKQERKQQAIQEQTTILKDQMNAKSMEKERKKQQSAEYAKFIKQKVHKLKQRQDFQRNVRKEQNSQLKKELEKQVQASKKKNLKEMSQIQKRFQKGNNFSLPGLENPFQNNQRQLYYLDKSLGIEPNRQKRLHKLNFEEYDGVQSLSRISKSPRLNLRKQQARLLQPNISLPEINAKIDEIPNQVQFPENLYQAIHYNQENYIPQTKKIDQIINSKGIQVTPQKQAVNVRNSRLNFDKSFSMAQALKDEKKSPRLKQQQQSKIKSSYQHLSNRLKNINKIPSVEVDKEVEPSNSHEIAVQKSQNRLKKTPIPLRSKLGSKNGSFNMIRPITQINQISHNNTYNLGNMVQQQQSTNANQFDIKRKSVPSGYANQNTDIQINHQRMVSSGQGTKDNIGFSNNKPNALINNQSQFSSSSVNIPDERMRGSGYILSQDPVSGLSKNSPRKFALEAKSQRSKIFSHFNSKQELSKFWNLSSELDKKIRYNMKATNLRNDYTQGKDSGMNLINGSSDNLMKRGYNIIS